MYYRIDQRKSAEFWCKHSKKMTKVDTKDNTIEDGDNDDNDDIDDDDDTTIKHRRQYDSETATGDGTTVDNNATNSNADVVDSAASVRKRTTIDESTLSAEDLHKLESRRAYNRHCAAKGTRRTLDATSVHF
jgi:hypothetical protein